MGFITRVWASNLVEELQNLDIALNQCRWISIDTEFPGFIKDTPRNAADGRKYFDLRFNVNMTKIVQLGLTVFDENFDVGGTWEFNFFFSREHDAFVPDSVKFLENCGIDFGKLEEDGIDAMFFCHQFSRILAKHSYLTWITFHGIYDIAHMLKLLTNKPLPNSIMDFNMTLGNVFGSVVDVKYMAKFCDCEGLKRGEVGLQKLAAIVGVNRIGEAHQAGSDCLLTAMVFAKMKMMFQVEESEYMGNLYDIPYKIPCLRRSNIHFVYARPHVLRCIPYPWRPVSFYLA